MDWGQHVHWLAWIAVALVAGILEVFSLDFVFVMVAGGALGAAGAAALGLGLVAQVLVFVAVSTLLLLTVRPALRRWARRSAPFVPTNVDALVGRQALALTPVTAAGGTVKLAGETWSARTPDPHGEIPAGMRVHVTAIDGATAVVRVTDQIDPGGHPDQGSVSR